MIANIICKPTFENEKKLKKMTSPLLQGFGLDTFWYYSLNEKGELSYVSNNSQMGDYFYSHALYKGHPYFRDPKLLTSGFFFPEKSSDSEYQKTQGKLRDCQPLDQIFVVMNSEGPKMQGYGFATTKRLPDLTNAILNNLFLFRKFISYFHEEGKDILKQMKNHTVDIASECQEAFYRPTTHFTQLAKPISPDAFATCFNPRQFEAFCALTAREKECLKWFIKGFSAVQIGKKIHLSNRTVEFYLNNIKNKLGCNTKQELFLALLDWQEFLQLAFFS